MTLTDFEGQLEKYADLAVKTGVNIQKDQTLVVNAPIESARLVRLIAKKAYETGAKHVHVSWSDDELTLTKFQLAPDEAFEEFPDWKAKGFEEMAANGAAFISIHATDPDLLKDVDPERVATANKTASQAMAGHKDYIINDKVCWTVISAPTKAWAEKIFPKLNSEQAVEELWQTIFTMTRADRQDPVQAWRDHHAALNEKVQYLQKKNYKKLHYRSKRTDVSIELPEGHVWFGGGAKSMDGTDFIPNIPTEEVFTAPKRTGVNGTIGSTKPLNYGGNLVDNFSLTFKDGKIVDFEAETGYDTLKHLIETDEGSHYLGEVALVPHDSPISNSNLLFYNTLFDENASCHVAIGSAYPTCLEGGDYMSDEELLNHGMNTSLTHVDFMIGSEDLAIDAETADGTIEPLFRDGNWAI